MTKDRLLLILSMFNTLSAVSGGLALIMGVNNPPPEWLAYTPFHTYILPGVLLLVIVGGSAAAATLSWRYAHSGFETLAFISGAIIACCIAGEVAFAPHLSGSQILYFLSGITIMGLTYPAPEPATRYEDGYGNTAAAKLMH